MPKSKFYKVSVCETGMSMSKGSYGGFDFILTKQQYIDFPFSYFIELGLSVSVFIVESEEDGEIQDIE